MSELPPVAPEAEKAVLGCIFLDPIIFAMVSHRIDGDMFYDYKNRSVFRAMGKVAMRDQVIEPLVVWEQIEQDNPHNDIEPKYITELADNVSTIAAIDTYIERVKDAHNARRIRRAHEMIGKAIEHWGGDTKGLAASVRSIIADALRFDGEGSSGTVILGDLLSEFCKDWEDTDVLKDVVYTGYRKLDNMTGGLRRGWVTVIAGRPGMGKSAFLRNITMNVAVEGKKVLCIELEDTNRQAVKRIISRYAQVPVSFLEEGRSTIENARKVISIMPQIKDKPLWLNDTAGMSSNEICNLAYAHKQKFGLDLLAVDHLLEISDKGELTDRVSKAMVNLRNLAKEMNIPVLLATQINRKVEERQTKKPVLSDLKQTGKIEEAARAVWLLYRPGYYEDEPDDPRLEVIVAKSTQGRTGTAKMHADLSTMSVSSWDNNVHGTYKNADEPDKPVSSDSAGWSREWEGY